MDSDEPGAKDPGPQLPPPPRRLPALESRAVVLGHLATLLGSLALVLASALIWLFVAAYGLGFSAILSLTQPRLQLPGKVVKSYPGQLWTGEPVHLTTASFTHSGAQYEVDSFGDPSAPMVQGQTVTLEVPSSSPEHAWVQGLQKFPLRLSGLAKIAALALLPGVVLTGWGLFCGFRQRRLLLGGSLAQARRTRHWGLPRPLAEQFLDRYELTDQEGKCRAFWSAGPDGPAHVDVLVLPSGWAGAVVVGRLLPLQTWQGQTVGGTGRGRRAAAWAVLLLWLGQLGVLALFLAT